MKVQDNKLILPRFAGRRGLAGLVFHQREVISGSLCLLEVVWGSKHRLPVQGHTDRGMREGPNTVLQGLQVFAHGPGGHSDPTLLLSSAQPAAAWPPTLEGSLLSSSFHIPVSSWPKGSTVLQQLPRRAWVYLIHVATPICQQTKAQASSSSEVLLRVLPPGLGQAHQGCPPRGPSSSARSIKLHVSLPFQDKTLRKGGTPALNLRMFMGPQQ